MKFYIQVLLTVFLFCQESYGSSQESITIASASAGRMLNFRNDAPSGIGYVYLRNLLSNSGNTKQIWHELPLLRLKEKNTVTRFDVIFPVTRAIDKNDFEIVEIGYLIKKLYLSPYADTSSQLKILVKPGLEDLVKKSPVLKRYNYQLSIISGLSLVDRSADMLKLNRADGFITHHFLDQEIAFKIPGVKTIDLMTPIILRMALRKSKIDTERVISELEKMGSFNEFFEKQVAFAEKT